VLERLRTKVAELEARLRESEADIIVRIEAGATVDGDVRVLTRRRQSVAWFTVCRRELGEGFVEAERSAWPVSFTKELQIP
jgi:transposase